MGLTKSTDHPSSMVDAGVSSETAKKETPGQEDRKPASWKWEFPKIWGPNLDTKITGLFSDGRPPKRRQFRNSPIYPTVSLILELLRESNEPTPSVSQHGPRLSS